MLVAVWIAIIGGGSFCVWYQFTGRIKRTVPCRPCKGEGFKPVSRRSSRTVRQVYSRCAACKGRGKRLRWAARRIARRNGRAR